MEHFDSARFINEVDNRILSLGQRIADFANLSDKYAHLETQYNDLKKSVESETIQRSLSSKNLSEKLKSLDEYLLENDGKHSKVQIENEILKQKIESIDDFISELLSKSKEPIKDILNLKEKISSLTSKLSDYERIIKSLDKKIEEQSNYKCELERDLNEIRPLISELNNLNYCHSQEQIFIKEKIKELDKSLDSAYGFFNSQISKCLGQFNDHILQIKNEFNIKVDSIKIPDISHLAPTKKLDDFRHEINVSLLDSSNSLAKSNNLEMQLQILSKKLEGIQIQLKTHELSQR